MLFLFIFDFIHVDVPKREVLFEEVKTLDNSIYLRKSFASFHIIPFHSMFPQLIFFYPSVFLYFFPSYFYTSLYVFFVLCFSLALYKYEHKQARTHARKLTFRGPLNSSQCQPGIRYAAWTRLSGFFLRSKLKP
jgi:hypothetical protein